jgi:hypothetical protein
MLIKLYNFRNLPPVICLSIARLDPEVVKVTLELFELALTSVKGCLHMIHYQLLLSLD